MTPWQFVSLGAGAGLAVLVVWALRRLPLRLERFAYAVMLVAIPTIYLVFGVRHGLDASSPLMQLELGTWALGVLCALLGRTVWPGWLAVGLFLHGAWDLAHLVLARSFVPEGYAAACVAFDLVAAFYASARVKDWRAIAPRTSRLWTGAG